MFLFDAKALGLEGCEERLKVGFSSRKVLGLRALLLVDGLLGPGPERVVFRRSRGKETCMVSHGRSGGDQALRMME